jgi:acetylornithine/N-succinyldiaminopimelate aminotransferase
MDFKIFDKLSNVFKNTKVPSMKADPLSAKSRKLVTKGQDYFLPNYKPREMILDHGMRSKLWDMDGKEYIDLGTGISVNSLGHQQAELVEALEKQLWKLWHTSNVFFTEPAVELAEALVNSVHFAKRVFFCNSGAEANEAAIKLVRKFAADRGKTPEQREIITFTGSFHGRTLTTTTATAQPKYQEGYEPLPGGFVYCDPFNDDHAIRALVSDRTCAIMVEPIQGEGGIMPAKPGFLKLLRELCDEVGALLIFDEVQCGMMRTGKMYAHSHDGVEPDIVTLAKALGCGFPIGATLVGEKAEHTMQFGSHGSTFGGNPMACAVALKALEIFQTEEIQTNVAEREAQLRERLEGMNRSLSIFREIRGKGLMVGAELIEKYHGKAGDVIELARQHGVLVLVAGPNVIRFLPPLNISKAELDEGLDRLEKALQEYVVD